MLAIVFLCLKVIYVFKNIRDFYQIVLGFNTFLHFCL